MKNKILIAFCMSWFSTTLWSQESLDSATFETFEYKDGDSIYVMQKYFLVFLLRGENKIENKEKAAQIQKDHLAYLGDLYKKGIICMNGPTGGAGDLRGMTVYRVKSLEEAKKLAEGDPAVKAGSLKVKVEPWWLARGTGVH